MCSLEKHPFESLLLKNVDKEKRQTMEAKVWRNLVPRLSDVRPSILHAFSVQNNIIGKNKRKRPIEKEQDVDEETRQSFRQAPPMNVRTDCDCLESVDTFEMLVQMYRQVRERQLPETLSLSSMECNVLLWSHKYLNSVKDEKCASLGRFLDLMRDGEIQDADLDMLIDQTELKNDRSSTEKVLLTLADSIVAKRTENKETGHSSSVTTTTTSNVTDDGKQQPEQEGEKEDDNDVIDPHIACGQDIYEALVKYHGGWFRPDIKYTPWERMTKRVMANRPAICATCSSTSSRSCSTSSTGDTPVSTCSTRKATLSPPARIMPTTRRRLNETRASRQIVARLSNNLKLHVEKSMSRFPISTFDLYARFFTECGVAKLLRHEMDLEHASMTRKYWDQLSERKAPLWSKSTEIEAVALKSRFAACLLRCAQETYMEMEEARLALMPFLDQFWPSMLQLLTCVRLRSQKHYALWSSTGSGKLTASLMAAKFIGSQKTLVVTSKAKVHDCIVEKRIETLFGDRTAPLVEQRKDTDEFVVVSYEQLKTLQDVEHFAQSVDFLVIDQAELAITSNNRAQMVLLRQNLRSDTHVLALCAAPTAPQCEGVHSFVSIIELLCGSRLDGIVDSENDYVLAFAYAHLYGFYYETPVTVSEQVVESKIKPDEDKNHLDIVQRFGNIKEKDLPEAGVVTLLKSYKKCAIQKALADATEVKCLVSSSDSGTNKDAEDNVLDKVLIYTSFIGSRCSVLEDIVNAVREQCPGARIGYAYCASSKDVATSGDIEAVSRFLLPSRDTRAYDVLIGTYLWRIEEVQCVCKRLVLYTIPPTDSDYERLCGTLRRWGQPASEILVYIPRCVVVQEPDATQSRLAYEDTFLQRLRHQARLRKAVLAGDSVRSDTLQGGIEDSGFFKETHNKTFRGEIVCNKKRAALSIVLALLRRVFCSDKREDNSKNGCGDQENQQLEPGDENFQGASGMIGAEQMLEKIYDKWMSFSQKDLYTQCVANPDTFWRPFHLLRDTVIENRIRQSHPAHAVAMYIHERQRNRDKQMNGEKLKNGKQEPLCVADIGCGRKPVLAAALVQLIGSGDNEALQIVSSDLIVENDMQDCIVQAESSIISNKDLPDNAFDFVVCCQSLMGSCEHMAAIVCRLRRALRYDKGSLIIVQPTSVFIAPESVVDDKNKSEISPLDALEVGLMLFDNQMSRLGMISDSPRVFFGDNPEFTLLSYCRFGSTSSIQRENVQSSLCYPARLTKETLL